jgi:hypothetical protein
MGLSMPPLRSYRIVVFLLGCLPATTPAQTYYKDGPRASDAERIATEMLNDAASGRFRPQPFGNAHLQAFDQWRADYEANQRANLDETLRYAARISAEYEERERAEAEAAELEERRRLRELENIAYAERRAEWEAERERMDSVVGEYLAEHDPVRLLQGALRSQTGGLSGYAFGYQSRWDKSALELQLFRSAAEHGEPLGILGIASLDVGCAPTLGEVIVGVHSRDDSVDRLRWLAELAAGDNLAARACLGAWCTGRDIGLGPVPALAPDGESIATLGLAVLRDAAAQHPVGHALLAHALATRPDSEAAYDAAQRALDAATFEARDEWRRRLYRLESTLARVRHAGRHDWANLRNSVNEKFIAETPAAALAYGRALLDGTCEVYRPADAAKLLLELPDHPYWRPARALGLLARGYDAELVNPEGHPPGQARSFFAAAVSRYAKNASASELPGVSDPHDQHEAKLWLLATRMRYEAKATTRDKAARELDALVDGGDAWARVLRAYVRLQAEGLDSGQARAIWSDLDGLALFEHNHAPARQLTLFRCVERLDALGAISEGSLLADWREQRSSPADSGGLLVRHAFTACAKGDVSMPRNLARVYATLVDAALHGKTLGFIGSSQWRHAAALAEVLQVDELAPELWDRGWLAEFKRKAEQQDSLYGLEPRTWWQLLREPTLEKIDAVARRDDSHLPAPDSYELDVQALLSSLRLRVAPTSEGARDATTRLIELSDLEVWHAQALLDSFERRYRESYLARSDLAGFHRDAARVAEAIGRSRSTGNGFLPRDPERAVRALTAAMLHGSTSVTRADLEALRADAGEAVRDSLRLLDQIATQTLSSDEIDAIEQQSYLLRTDIERRGERLLDYSTRERVAAMARAIHGARGLEATLAYVDNQRAHVPFVDWDFGELYADGAEWLPQDPVAALGCFRRAAERAPDAATLRQRLLHWKLAAAHGERTDLELASAQILETDLIERMLRAGILGRWIGEDVYLVAQSCAALETPAPRERVFALQRLAVALGWDAALASFGLRADLSAAECLAIGRATLECSTLNASLAVPWLERALEAGADPAVVTAAAAELAEWRSADGSPTWRYGLVQELRAKRHDAKELAQAAEAPELEPERLKLLLRASFKPEALEIAERVYGIPPELIEIPARYWRAHLRGKCAGAEWSKLLALLAKAPIAARELDAQGGNFAEPRELLADEIGLCVGVLARLPSAPEGIDAQAFATQLDDLLEYALLEQSLDAYLLVLERAARGGDTALVALAARLVATDLGNATLLEATLLPRLADRAAFDALYVAHGLYAAGGAEPTPLLQFLREHGERQTVERWEAGAVVEGEVLPALQAPLPAWKYGSIGRRLSVLRYTEWPLVLRAFDSLGLRPEDADALRLE